MFTGSGDWGIDESLKITSENNTPTAYEK